MKITQSDVQLAGQRQAAREHRVTEQLQLSRMPSQPLPDPVALSAAARAAQQADTALDLRAELEGHPLWQLIQQLVKKLTGQEIELDNIVPPGRQQRAAEAAAPAPAPISPITEWRVSYLRREEIHETEQTRFSAQGSVKTADGRQIDFTAALDLYREYHEVSEVMLDANKAPVRKDPLVVNHAAASASLTEEKFAFDLDADGVQDSISFAGPGSSFLALDRNGDGQINDGSELFGTRSGNGFADLAQLDDDGNGWIDESDRVWGSLKLWLREESGELALIDLAAAGIGALYLGSARTDFSLHDRTHRELGQVRQSGVFLGEDGRVGTLQQVDLAV
ncbi:hypothetical protein [Chitinimonas sp. BJYL2]|uniref:hypothetical protein n=1 Tax=Chitinimonas sp. BJYL2 TaxID=2976696 RepID=UPI0022B3C5F6|nr:hypothetical protein [Chitinimonas sp. BJYL2]